MEKQLVDLNEIIENHFKHLKSGDLWDEIHRINRLSSSDDSCEEKLLQCEFPPG